VKRARARALWTAGFRSVRAIASARPEDIVNAVGKAFGPYGDGVAKQIIGSAKKLLERKSRELRQTAEEMLNGTGLEMEPNF